MKKRKPSIQEQENINPSSKGRKVTYNFEECSHKN